MYSKSLLGLAALPLSLALPSPQIFGPDCTKAAPKYHTKTHQNVTASFPGQGWLNWGDSKCSAGTSGCSISASESKTVSVGVSFGGGPTFKLSDALSAGLTFGVDVAVSTTTGTTQSEACPTSGDDGNPCVCGLMYRPTMFRATGTITQDGEAACSVGQPSKFNVTSVMIDPVNKQPHIEFANCRSSLSSCSQMAHMPACPNGQ